MTWGAHRPGMDEGAEAWRVSPDRYVQAHPPALSSRIEPPTIPVANDGHG